MENELLIKESKNLLIIANVFFSFETGSRNQSRREKSTIAINEISAMSFQKHRSVYSLI